MAADSFVQVRQIAMIDSKGNTAAFTGNKTSSAAGHYMGNIFWPNTTIFELCAMLDKRNFRLNARITFARQKFIH